MNVLSITGPSICDGLGCRIVIWFAGCNHQCEGCHNKWTWNYNQGSYILNNNVLDKIYNKVKRKEIQGITLSGGDPLAQTEESLSDLYNFIIDFKQKFPEKDIWIYSGDTFENLIQNDFKNKILKECDVLVDGPFILEEKDVTIGFRGSRNQRIIDLKQTYKKPYNEIVKFEIE